ncbi:MAG: hypothetical protein ACRES9_08565 [Gammaproteobacteria bacterium]
MTRKELRIEVIALLGTAILAGLLFWLALYLVGIAILLPAALVLFVALAALQRKMRNLQSLAEYAIFAWLLATQAGLLIAILMRLAPSLGPKIGGLI